MYIEWVYFYKDDLIILFEAFTLKDNPEQGYSHCPFPLMNHKSPGPANWQIHLGSDVH